MTEIEAATLLRLAKDKENGTPELRSILWCLLGANYAGFPLTPLLEKCSEIGRESLRRIQHMKKDAAR